jgi:four helix bundle protein
MQGFRDLRVWRSAHKLTLDIYSASRAFPKEELYGLTSQIRRAATSIPANIAEGCGRSSDRDFARFLYIASGSASELEYHLLLARQLGLVEEESYAELANSVIEVKRMLGALIQRLIADS